MCRRDEAATTDSPEGGRAAPGEPSQRAGPVFKVLPGNLPRGAGGCGWGTSSSDGEAELSTWCDGVPAQWVSTWGRGDEGILALGVLGLGGLGLGAGPHSQRVPQE